MIVIVPSKIAELEQLPKELRIGPMANYFGDAWAAAMNGQQRAAIGLYCERDWLPSDKSDPMINTAQALMDAGGLPVPIFLGGGNAASQLAKVSGLLLPGGNDIDPKLYGQEPAGDTKMEQVDSENDQLQLECVRLASELGMPILGVCRGAQILNVAHGGTLRQALPNDHQQKNPSQESAHGVVVEPGSEMAGAEQERSRVNSKHHQAVDQLAPGFRATAKAPDGTIECIERARPWAVGCEFHPETQRATDSSLENFFDRLVEKAQAFAQGGVPSTHDSGTAGQ